MGQSSVPIWLLGTIEFIWAGWIPLKPHHKIIPPQNNFFRDHFLVPKRSPGQNVDPGIQNPTSASKIHPPAMKKQKMRAEKPCRTPPSKNQTEPYSASYGRKPFWGVPLKIRGAQGLPRRHLRGKTLILYCENQNHLQQFYYLLEKLLGF